MAILKEIWQGVTGAVRIFVPDASGSSNITFPAKSGTVALVEDFGTWTAYTPTLSATTGTLTNATVTARFSNVGKVYHVNFQIVIVDNGSATGSLVMTTPVTSVAGLFHGVGRNSGTAHAVLVTRLNTTQVYMQKLIDGTYPGSNGHTISGSFTFEGA